MMISSEDSQDPLSHFFICNSDIVRTFLQYLYKLSLPNSDILEKLPETFKYDEIRKRYGIEVQPTTVVLLQEVQRISSGQTR